MKIAIVTLYGLFNYGNRLQNYALQHVIEKLGHNVETLAVDNDVNVLKRIARKYLEKTNGKLKLRASIDRKRENKFAAFDKHYIHIRYLHTKEKRISSDTGYECFVVGSDQVWNPLFWENTETSSDMYNYLLQFTEKRKISYAASFGIDTLPEQWIQRMIPKIADFDYISVRETSGKTILDECGKEIAVVLDPTMLVTSKEWRRIESNFLKEHKKYILIYFLGCQSENVKILIQETAKKMDLEIIDMMDINNAAIYAKGPDMFLEAIDKAEIVFTDSFHASVFSLIFHTPFAVWERNHENHSDMNGRINTLLNNVGIQNGISSETFILHQNFEETDQLLRIEREKSLSFLKNALK